MSSVGVAVITHSAKHHLPHCLPPILQSSLKPRTLVVNSSSNDGTVELAQELGAETHIIPRADFNHGATREAARKLLGTEYIVMITPDAYALDSSFLETLVSPLLHHEASIAYARQIPHNGANFFEKFSRDYNYPNESHIRSIHDLSHYGVYTFFCSNSCAAYRNSALDEVGGFPTGLFGEDTVAVAKMLHKGHKIAYVADAVVKHSHRYSLQQEFKRHFDIGFSRKDYEDLISAKEGDKNRGKDYVKTMMKQLMQKEPHKVPYACVQTLVKYLGYQMGRRSTNAPLWLKKRCSSQDFYWTSNHYRAGGEAEKGLYISRPSDIRW